MSSTLFEHCVGSFTSHRINYEELWDGTYGLPSLSEKTSTSNHLQMSLQRSYFLLNSLKTLSVGLTGVATHNLKRAILVLYHWANRLVVTIQDYPALQGRVNCWFQLDKVICLLPVVSSNTINLNPTDHMHKGTQQASADVSTLEVPAPLHLKIGASNMFYNLPQEYELQKYRVHHICQMNDSS